MKRSTTLALLLVLLTGTSGFAQFISATVSPTPTTPGAYVQGSVEANTLTYLFSGCLVDQVHQGSPAGPVVWPLGPVACIGLAPLVGPGNPYSAGGIIGNAFNEPGNPAAPGRYYLRYSGSDAATGTVLTPQFIPIRIDAPGTPAKPVLSPVGVGVAARGASVPLQITADATEAGSLYHILASLTSNTGLDVSPLERLDLDQDILFDLSFPVHHPALFTNGQGTLDAAGGTTAPAMHIPNVPALQGFPLKIQAVLLGGPCGVCFTNTLSYAIY